MPRRPNPYTQASPQVRRAVLSPKAFSLIESTFHPDVSEKDILIDRYRAFANEILEYALPRLSLEQLQELALRVSGGEGFRVEPGAMAGSLVGSAPPIERTPTPAPQKSRPKLTNASIQRQSFRF